MWTTVSDMSEVIVKMYNFDDTSQGSRFLLVERAVLNFHWLIYIAVCVIFLIFCILIFIWKKMSWWKLRNWISQRFGPKGLPIVGNAFELAVPAHEIFRVIKGWMKTFGPVVQGRVGKQTYIFLADPVALEKILSSNIEIEKSYDYGFLTNWLGTGLLTSKGQKWHSRRKLLTSAFHFQILDHFMEIFNEQSEKLVEILEIQEKVGEIFDFFPHMTRCALDIICETAMGEKIYAQDEKNESEYAKAVSEMTVLILERMTRPWLRLDFVHSLLNGRREKRLLKILHSFTEKVIQHRKEERKNMVVNLDYDNNEDNEYPPRHKRRLAFLDLLLDASDDGKLLSDQDIREETDTFMFEGHDTTAASISWTTLLLASNPHCQEKVREELRSIFGNDERPVTTSDLTKMKYLECCIREALRLYPSVPFFGRQLMDDLDLGNGRIAPKNSVIFIVLYLLHRNPEVFPNPETFNPDRFLPENLSWRKPFNYIPFSAGARNCIGQKFAMTEEKVVLSHIFRSFHVDPGERLQDVKLIPAVVLRPMEGLRIRLTRL